jgi:hypothetical protein
MLWTSAARHRFHHSSLGVRGLAEARRSGEWWMLGVCFLRSAFSFYPATVCVWFKVFNFSICRCTISTVTVSRQM